MNATARRVVRRVASLGMVCGVYATVVWYYVQGAPSIAVGVAALTALLVALVAYNERYGSTPLYP